MFEFRFGAPENYYLFLLVPLLIFFYIYAKNRKKKALARFGNAKLLSKLTRSVSKTRRGWKVGLSLMGLVLMMFALVQPQYSTKFEEVRREGIDLIIALDTSKSM